MQNTRKVINKHHPHTYIIRKEHLPNPLNPHVLQKPISPPQIKIKNRSKSEQRPPRHFPQLQQKTQQQSILRTSSRQRQPMQFPREKYRDHKKSCSTDSKVKHIKKVKAEIPNSLQDYSKFIKSVTRDGYQIEVCFDKARNKITKDKLDLQTRKVITLETTVFETIHQNFTIYTQNSNQIIQNSCIIYLQCQDKHKLQLLLSVSYPKLLHSKLRPYLIYQRQVIYIVFVLSKSNFIQKLTHSQHTSIKLTTKYIKQCLEILLEPIRMLQKQRVSPINQTFSYLRAIGEVDKKLNVIDRQIQRIFLKASRGLLQIQQLLHKLLNNKEEWPLQKLAQLQMQISWKYFKFPPFPYLPSKGHKLYTLVVEVDNVLIHYDRLNKTLRYRPYIDIFLTKLRDFFEIVIYTSGSHEYTQILLTQIEKDDRYFDYLLCESHLVLYKEQMVKDYSRLGRNPKKMIIVDCLPPVSNSYLLNYLQIQKWSGSALDMSLRKLCNILWELKMQQMEDVRDYFRDINSELLMIEEKQDEILL